MDVVPDGINSIGKATVKANPAAMMHPRSKKRNDDNDVQQGHVVHKPLNFQIN